MRSEFVVAVVGKVCKREGAVNENLATGDIEIVAEQVRILSESETPPFPVEENSKTKEEIRLKYRYLDLRRPDVQRNMILRSKICAEVRSFLNGNNKLASHFFRLGKAFCAAFILFKNNLQDSASVP